MLASEDDYWQVEFESNKAFIRKLIRNNQRDFIESNVFIFKQNLIIDLIKKWHSYIDDSNSFGVQKFEIFELPTTQT